MKRIQANITGRVQGVGFRNFVWQQARAAGVHGFVRNTRDGSVEVVAEGEEPALEQLRQKLWKGPLLSRVDDVAIDESPATGEFTDFQVRY